MNIKTATSTTTATTLLPESGRKNRDTSSAVAASSSSLQPTTTGTSTISTTPLDGYKTTTAINSMLGVGTATKTTSLETYPSMFFKKSSFTDKGLLTTTGGSVHKMVVAGRSVRDAEKNSADDPTVKCLQFTEGEENEFYSPDYPNNYPKNITCTRIIEGESLNNNIGYCCHAMFVTSQPQRDNLSDWILGTFSISRITTTTVNLIIWR